MALVEGNGDFLDKYEMIRYTVPLEYDYYNPSLAYGSYWFELPFDFPIFDTTSTKCFVNHQGHLTFDTVPDIAHTIALAQIKTAAENSDDMVPFDPFGRNNRVYSKQFLSGTNKAFAIRIEHDNTNQLISATAGNISVTEFILFDNGDIQIKKVIPYQDTYHIQIANEDPTSDMYTQDNPITYSLNDIHRGNTVYIIWENAESYQIKKSYYYKSDATYKLDEEKKIIGQLIENISTNYQYNYDNENTSNASTILPKSTNIYTKDAIIENGGTPKYCVDLNGKTGYLNHDCNLTGYKKSNIAVSPDGVNNIRIHSNIGIVSDTEFTYIPFMSFECYAETAPLNTLEPNYIGLFEDFYYARFPNIIKNVRGIYFSMWFSGDETYVPTINLPYACLYCMYDEDNYLTQTGSYIRLDTSGEQDPKRNPVAIYHDFGGNRNIRGAMIVPAIDPLTKGYAFSFDGYGYLKIANGASKER